jgi:hypothetical protein
MNSPIDLLAAVCDAFSSSIRPQRFTVDSSDDEVVRAESIFASRNPETLRSTDVGIGAGWPEVYLNQQSRIYYMSGFVRLVLETDAENGFQVDDFCKLLSPDRIDSLNQRQKVAIAAVLDFIRDRLHEHGKEILDRRLKRLREWLVGWVRSPGRGIHPANSPWRVAPGEFVFSS